MKTRSILPNSSPEILQPIIGKTGTFLVSWVDQLDMHILFFTDFNNNYQHVVAGHHNGFSCRSLAERLNKGKMEDSLEQFKYILRCGGIGSSEELIRNIVQV